MLKPLGQPGSCKRSSRRSTRAGRHVWGVPSVKISCFCSTSAPELFLCRYRRGQRATRSPVSLQPLLRGRRHSAGFMALINGPARFYGAAWGQSGGRPELASPSEAIAVPSAVTKTVTSRSPAQPPRQHLPT